MVESPQRIWIEADDECPYFYEAHELHDVEQDVIEYVRADLYAALEAQLAEAIKASGEQARLRGEAEGKLAASEMAGIIEGWKERAEKAEAQLAALKAAMEAGR